MTPHEEAIERISKPAYEWDPETKVIHAAIRQVLAEAGMVLVQDCGMFDPLSHWWGDGPYGRFAVDIECVGTGTCWVHWKFQNRRVQLPSPYLGVFHLLTRLQYRERLPEIYARAMHLLGRGPVPKCDEPPLQNEFGEINPYHRKRQAKADTAWLGEACDDLEGRVVEGVKKVGRLLLTGWGRALSCVTSRGKGNP